MKSKNLALTNGIVGLVGGIILLFGGWFIAGGIVSDAATGSVSNTSGAAAFLNILKIAVAVYGQMLVERIFLKIRKPVKIWDVVITYRFIKELRSID